MKRIVILLFGFIAVSLLSSCNDTPSVTSAPPKPADSNKVSAPAAVATLDIIVGGPFVFVQSSANCGTQPPPCLVVWIPKVKGHTTINGLDANAQFKSFDTGTYDFTSGVNPSVATTIVTPVQGASIYSISAKTQNIPPQPKTKPFATLILPTPREIVSWNADPMTVSGSGSLAPTLASKNLATLVVLRYDYQEGGALEVRSAGDTFWKPVPIKKGNERILVIGFAPQNPTANEDQHTHAVEAFRATTAMLGVKWNISFDNPPPTFQRNRPFDANWPLPQDLLDVIDQVPLKTSGGKFVAPLSNSFSVSFGKINDCKALAILVAN
jgi:hypothetical protein